MAPPIRRLHAQRDALVAERDGLLAERDALRSERNALLAKTRSPALRPASVPPANQPRRASSADRPIDWRACFSVPLVDLGAGDPRYAGVLCPQPEVGLPKVGVSEALLSGAEAYFHRFQQFDYIAGLIQNELDAIGYSPTGLAVDLGSGFGNTVIPLLENFPDLSIIAVDISPDLLAILRREADKRGVVERCATVAMDAQRDYFAADFADSVFGCAVLHHMADPESVVRTALKILKPGGHAIFLEPFENGHAIVRLAYVEILNAAKARNAAGPGLEFLAAMITDIAVRSHRRNYPGWHQKWFHLDDKWLFTRSFFDRICTELNATGLRVRSLHDPQAPFTAQTVTALTAYGGLTCPDALPEWAWDILRRYDEDAFSLDLKRDLTLEGAVVITK